MTILAGVELGGTKCVCIWGTGPDDIRAMVKLPTTTPDETLAAIRAVLGQWDHEALGIASFGPLNLDPASPRYGRIVHTPKPGWNQAFLADLAGGKPFALDTDTNGAAIAEGLWGGAQGLSSWAYITIGTGIGVGSIVAGKPVRGLGHSEGGHMRIPRGRGDSFPGICRYHADCVEGLASGPAIEARTGMSGRDIAPDHPVWLHVADALAALCHNLMLTTLPQRILIGGGVAAGQPQLFPLLRDRLVTSIADYGGVLRLAGPLSAYVAPPALGKRAGPLGALALAASAVF